MIKILRFIWELPQCLVGVIMRLFCKGEDIDYKGEKVRYSKAMSGGISLGLFIVFAEHYKKEGEGNSIKHEYGHSRQSLYLGPLYLLVIGLPSLIWAAFYNGDERGYYTGFYTERWADKLGGVKR